MPEKIPAFTPPENGQADFLIIAGEHSGDQHAARVIRSLKDKNPDFKIVSIGGPQLARQTQQLVDLTNYSVVGLVEVLKHIRQFRQLFYQTLNWIKTYRPKQLILVDYPGFNLRLAKALYASGISEKGGGEVRIHYYIGPQIWAWKAKRRFKMARWLNGLGVIFPFETEIYKDTTLPVEFVGHPLVDSDSEKPVRFQEGAPLLILPGSRQGPIKRILPEQLEAFRLLRKKNPDLSAIILYPDEPSKNTILTLISNDSDLKTSIQLLPAGEAVNGSAVITSSGTMSLICALAGLPGCLVYKAHPMTYWIGTKLVKIPFLGMPNILLGKEVYPEYIQSHFRREVIAERILNCLQNRKYQDQAAQDAKALKEVLQAEEPSPVKTTNWLMQNQG